MLTTETLLAYSVEGFLEPDEIAALIAEMDDYNARVATERRTAGTGNTIHSIKGLNDHQAVAVFEPEGRVEVEPIPKRADAILAAAVERRLPDIQRAYPSVATIEPWVYLEYAPGQFITPHADLYKNKDAPEHPKIGGISVQLNEDFTGGELYIETCGSSRIWTTDDGPERVVRRMNNSSEEFRAVPRTRWTSSPAVGTAFIYGSQLVHGTNPVIEGRVRKFISWLNA